MPHTKRMDILVLAALLHDIGKFAQRARRPKSAALEGDYCPTYRGRPSHLHVLYSDYFIEKDLPLPPELEPFRSRIARLASIHHRPEHSDLLEQVLARADRLSAGMDRRPQEEDSGDHRSARLLSVFSQIRLLEQGDAPRKYHRLVPIEEDPFPTDLDQARQTDYTRLFEGFLQELDTLPLDMGVAHYLSSLVALLERHTWCIPSSTYNTEPDISLYDHAVTTAAIAQALALFHLHHGDLPGSGETPKFILLGGDLSGIQSYIFAIEKSHGTGVAKLLRARSFHLQVLTHSVVLSLLERTGLLPQARIMDAGGRFILLLPAIPAVEELLPGFTMEVQDWFFREFKGCLSLNLSHAVRMGEADFDLAAFHRRLDEFFDHLEMEKTQKFSALLKSGRSPIASHGHGDFSAGACAVCQINPVSEAASARYAQQTGKSPRLCAQCEAQISRIGGQLPNATFAVFSKTPSAGAVPLFGGLHLSLHRADEVESRHREALDILNLRGRHRYTHHAIAGHLPRFLSGDALRWEQEGRQSDPDEKIQPDAPKTFTHLAQEARIADGTGTLRGKAFLGALKADVDNLGLLFGIGFGDRLSLSRFAGLSRLLNHFFAEVMTGMIRDNPQHSDIYTVFAGGDDLFLIGPWHQLMAFARDLEAEFRRYVADNSDITLSAGIFIAKPTLPANTIARNAEELLEKSKSYGDEDKNSRSKNAVTALGVSAGWEEYAGLMARGLWLEQLALNGSVPRGLLMRLMGYADDCNAFLSGRGGRRSGLYRSRMRYDFARNLNSKTLAAQDRQDLEALGTDPAGLRQMRLAISYALYRMRTD